MHEHDHNNHIVFLKLNYLILVLVVVNAISTILKASDIVAAYFHIPPYILPPGILLNRAAFLYIQYAR